MNSIVDRVMLSAWIIIGTGAGTVLYLGLNAQATAEGGGTGIQAVHAIFYVCFVALLALSYRTSLSLIVEEKWILLLWFWVLMSTSWSVQPGVTLRRSVALLGTTLLGLFVATRFEPRDLLRIIAHCVGLTAVVSLAVCLLFPHFGVAQTGEWNGVFYQKNELGRAMALGILSYTFLALGQRRGRISAIFMGALCAGMMLMSRSMGAILVCLLMLMIIPGRSLLLLPARKLVGYSVAAFTLGIATGILVVQNWGAILKGLGRDPTLTGRIPLWQEVLDQISTNPWHGFGYSAFWYSAAGTRIQQKLYWQITHSHNGYLELTLGLGLIGLALLSVILLKTISRGIYAARDSYTIFNFWPLFYLIYALVDNLTESWFVTANSLVWMLFVANSYWLVRKSLEPAMEEDDETLSSAEFSLDNPIGMKPAES
jgi:exopolysaccharide production protein ExoQ